MKSKKGLSTVVTTLIIILLVLVAVGIIWGVVNNLLGKSTGTIEISTKCLDVDVKATKVVDNGDGGVTYNVTLKRSPSGEGDVGAKLAFFNSAGNSEIIDFGEMLSALETSTQALTVNYANSTWVEVTPYFLDTETNKETLCPTTTKFEFE